MPSISFWQLKLPKKCLDWLGGWNWIVQISAYDYQTKSENVRILKSFLNWSIFVLYLIQCIKPSPTLTTPEFVHKGHIYSIASLNANLIKVWKLTSKNCYFSTHFVVHSRKYISFLIELTVFLPSAALVELKPHFQP